MHALHLLFLFIFAITATSNLFTRFNAVREFLEAMLPSADVEGVHQVLAENPNTCEEASA